jgi:hypothetical protein
MIVDEVNPDLFVGQAIQCPNENQDFLFRSSLRPRGAYAPAGKAKEVLIRNKGVSS